MTKLQDGPEEIPGGKRNTEAKVFLEVEALLSRYGITVTELTGIIQGRNNHIRIDHAPDTTPSVITLNGASTITIPQGETYTEPGASWIDTQDGIGTVSLIRGAVDTTTLGTYYITYSRINSSGNSATPVTRTVNVVASAGMNSSITNDDRIK